jgi:hypothetical protein
LARGVERERVVQQHPQRAGVVPFQFADARGDVVAPRVGLAHEQLRAGFGRQFVNLPQHVFDVGAVRGREFEPRAVQGAGVALDERVPRGTGGDLLLREERAEQRERELAEYGLGGVGARHGRVPADAGDDHR